MLRVLRATHPKLGWNRPLGKTFAVTYVLILGALLLVVAFTILSLYTLNPTTKSVVLLLQRGAIPYLLIFNVMSLVLLLLSLLLSPALDNENFGTGSMGSKLSILGVAVFFSIFIASFRTGTVWAAARPALNPAWYDSKVAFYVILFGFEIIIVYLFPPARVDRRLWIPNGSNKPGDFSRINLDGSMARETSEQDKASVQDMV